MFRWYQMNTMEFLSCFWKKANAYTTLTKKKEQEKSSIEVERCAGKVFFYVHTVNHRIQTIFISNSTYSGKQFNYSNERFQQKNVTK